VLTVVVLTLGAANGMFAIGSIGSMMALTGDAEDGRAGVRLGVFGAAQALAYAVGTVTGAGGVDLAQAVLGSPVRGYQLVFLAEAVLFVGAAGLAMRSASRERGTVVFRQHGELLPAVLQS
jgi:BCD family chlorophyll transporter-like MFS transporter